MRKLLQMHHSSATSAAPSEPQLTLESVRKPMRKQVQHHNFAHPLDLCCARSYWYFGLWCLKMEPWGHRYSHGFGSILMVIGVRRESASVPTWHRHAPPSEPQLALESVRKPMRKLLQMHHFFTTSAPPSEPQITLESVRKPMRKLLQMHHFSTTSAPPSEPQRI